tara:strand:+ start:1408 stop:1779 length:372 start_codon:yes stop_codon:yes gene_type:complete
MKAEIKSVKIYQVTCPGRCNGHVHNLSHNQLTALTCHVCGETIKIDNNHEIKADEALQSVINAVQSGVPYRLKGLGLEENEIKQLLRLKGLGLEECEYEELSHLAISKKTIELVVKTLKDMLS